MTTAQKTPDWNMFAAEYVLRLMPAKEEAAFERHMAKDGRLRDLVSHWTRQFEGLNSDFAEEKPRRQTKAALMDSLFADPVQGRSPIWQRLWLWQGVSLAALAVAGFLSFQMIQPVSSPVSQPGFVAEVAAEDDSLRLLAVYAPDTGALQLTRTAGEALPGRALELWVIDGDNAPVSLGVLPNSMTAAVQLPQGLRDKAGLVLAVSDEPLGGSPTGAPTGAVLAVGATYDI